MVFSKILASFRAPPDVAAFNERFPNAGMALDSLDACEKEELMAAVKALIVQATGGEPKTLKPSVEAGTLDRLWAEIRSQLVSGSPSPTGPIKDATLPPVPKS